ncbi:MAG: primosomal protein N' [Roseburia sp.]|nr:primosomal protein N' [Roseburia sp.]MBQ8518463.1 primosomal protein N' [Agathobacter sp.]
MAKYANIIVDISHEKLDKTFQYLIPQELVEEVRVGVLVDIPFGNRSITGYVVELTDEAEFDVSRLKPIIGVKKGSVPIESQLIELAGWMRKNYGGTMNQALKTVIPIKQKTKAIERKMLKLLIGKEEAIHTLALYETKHFTAKARLLRELMTEGVLDYSIVTQKLHVSSSTVKALEKEKVLEIETTKEYRNPVNHLESKGYHLTLNEMQQTVVDHITTDITNGLHKTYLLKGVTGSGKTEVYMELIARTIASGKQAIVLIPEIALTFQTVMRFYNRFGDRVSIMNSRLSQGERYDQYLRAKNGDIDIMIGPRSALFAPFERLGLIIIDEEHEASYKSETIPRYHARETAIERARQNNASVVLGSATPSMDSFYHAQNGEYELLELTQRVQAKPLPSCEVIDLREELRNGNRSILSERLQELMEDRLAKKQQMMLFINRRGVAGFMSCRACGYVVKCPHCDVSLSQHNNGKMVCHYCGYEEPEPSTCPSCGSKYISGFKAGTQKIEDMVKKRFPQARVLRMDFDTTRTKDSYEQILQAFANQEADILIGTQMIVKGHDFPNVTLVGVLAADMSLHISDFHAAERTFQLLTQAAGRAGRGEEPGDVIIQTYNPEHYAVLTAKAQDYECFYEQEIMYRQLGFYPPVWNLLLVMCTSENEKQVQTMSEKLVKRLQGHIDSEAVFERKPIQVVGPADATIARVNDIYRKVIYIKTKDYQDLVRLKDRLEYYMKDNRDFQNVSVQFDFNPMSGF